MTPKKIDARPKAIKPSIKSLIVKRAIENPDYDRRLLALELIGEITKVDEIPPTEETLIKYISEARSKYSEDNSWSSALLNKQSINPEAVPMIMFSQLLLKKCLSRPLTIREAKWFNNLFARYSTLPTPQDLDADIDREVKTLIIVTWSQLYAYREKIDSIAGIKEPDYSDIDELFIQNDLPNACWINAKRFIKEIASIETGSGTYEERREIYIKESNKISKRFSDNDIIMTFECNFLGFSMGTPNMQPEAIKLYLKTLDKYFGPQSLFKEELKQLSFPEGIKLMLRIRYLCNEEYQKYKNEIPDIKLKDGE